VIETALVSRCACTLLLAVWCTGLAAQRPVRGETHEVQRIVASERDWVAPNFLIYGPNRELVIGQPDDFRVLVLGDQGEVPVATLGRQGSGPGEFASVGIAGTLGTTIWVLDPRNRRTHFWNSDFQYIRTTAWPSELRDASGVRIVGASISPRAYLPDGSGIYDVLLNSRQAGPVLDFQGSVRGLVKVGADSRIVGLVTPIRRADCSIRPPEGSGLQGSFGKPICEAPLHDVSPDGKNVVVVESNPVERRMRTLLITIFSTDRGGSKRVSAELPAISIPKSIRDSLINSYALAIRNPTAQEWYRTHVEVPEHFPGAKSVIAGAGGSIMIGLWGGGTQRTWLILRSGSEALEEFSFPSGFSPRLLKDRIVTGLETDNDGFRDVVSYTLISNP
jgi:hypothetical protein